jgi:hypothetical protein
VILARKAVHIDRTPSVPSSYTRRCSYLPQLLNLGSQRFDLVGSFGVYWRQTFKVSIAKLRLTIPYTRTNRVFAAQSIH